MHYTNGLWVILQDPCVNTDGSGGHGSAMWEQGLCRPYNPEPDMDNQPSRRHIVKLNGRRKSADKSPFTVDIYTPS